MKKKEERELAGELGKDKNLLGGKEAESHTWIIKRQDEKSDQL